MKRFHLILAIAFAAPPYASAEVRPLTLEEAVSRTLQNNPAVIEARRQRDLAALEEPRYLAVMDPGARARYAYRKDRTPPEVPFLGDKTTYDEYGIGFSKSWITGTQVDVDWVSERTHSNAQLRFLNPAAAASLEIAARQALLRDLWGRPDKAIRGAARAAVTAAEADLARLEHSLAAQAAQDYWTLSAGFKLLELEKAALADARKLVAKQSEKRRYGTALRTDVLQAEANAAQHEADIVVTENLIARRQNRLLETMGEIERAPADVQVVPVSTHAASGHWDSTASALEEAWRARPDLRAALARVEAGEFALTRARLNVLPRLDLTGAWGLAGLDNRRSGSYDDLFSGDHPFVRTGLELTMPLGFKRQRIDRDEARYRLALEKANLEGLRRRIAREVRTARENWRAAKAKLEAFEKLFEAQEAKSEEEVREFERGRSTTDQLIRFYEDARAAERRLVSAREDLALAEINLHLAVGISIPSGAYGERR